MRLDRYTVKAQEALQQAQTLAASSAHPEIRDVHLLLALLAQPDGIVVPTLRKIGADAAALEAAARRAVNRLPRVQGDVAEPGISRALSATLEAADKAAQAFR